MENLISTANDKSTANNQTIINDITSLCVLAVIFSDFEIEIFFDINNFSPNFQKTILFQTINFCCDRLKDQEKYIELKFQFWILKMMNKLLANNGEIETSSTISKEELIQSLDSLSKVVEQNYFNNSDDKQQCLIIKIAYELGLYYYYRGVNDKCEYNFNFLLNNLGKFSPQFQESKFYFKEDKIRKLLKYIRRDTPSLVINDNVEMEVESEFDMNSNFIVNEYVQITNQNMNENEFNVDSISTNLIEYSSLQENLMKSQNLITLSLKNENILKEAIVFTNKFKEYITTQLTKNISKAEENELQNANKEVSFHYILLKLMELMFKGDDKLPKNFLSNLSQTILKYTITDNLRISGLIHGIILNFPSNFKLIYTYFTDFVDFFNKTNVKNKEETVNIIIFISHILSVLNLAIKGEAKDIVISDELHFNLINIFLYWAGKTEEQISRRDNIANILVNTLKINDYLHILKIIFIGVLKFILDKKHLTMGNSNEIYDCLYASNPSLFKIDKLIKEEISSCKSEKLSQLVITFKENLKKSYSFDALLIPNYLHNLFKLLSKVENKIELYEHSFSECDILIRRININFFDVIENHFNPEKATNLINDFIKMYSFKYSEFKSKYFTLDLINNISLCNEMYEEFKTLLDQNLLLTFVYVLSLKQNFLEAALLLQYMKNIDYDLVYKLLKNSLESTTINFNKFAFIWKSVYFEYLSNFFYIKRNEDALRTIKELIKRTSNHQFFKKHPLRKHFKIINFFKILDNI